MTATTWFKNISLAALAIIAMELPGTSAHADTSTINQYGYWEAVSDTAPNGDEICGIRTHMTNGAELRLMVIGGEVHLVAHDPAWSIPTDATRRVSVSVDGEQYRGRAVAADPKTLVVASLTMNFLEQFMEGMAMEAQFGGDR